MKKTGCIIVCCIFFLSLAFNVSAIQKITITDRYFVFDVWQGDGDVSVIINENYFSEIVLRASEFEALKTENNIVSENCFYIDSCDGEIVITLKESYLSALEDGCYNLKAEFANAIIPVRLYIMRQVSEFSGAGYNFSPYLREGTSTVTFNTEGTAVAIYPDLFEKLSFDGETVDEKNYSLDAFADVLSVTLSSEYLKAFEPGEYYFSADFSNIKNITVKLRIFGSNAPGDVDCDGKISSGDARKALRAVVGLEALSTEQYMAADIDNDNIITAADARTLLRIAIGAEKLKTV